MLALGSSKPWPDALEVLTGERVLNANAILEYFAPLARWIEAKNNMLGVEIGWDHSDGEITHFISNLLIFQPDHVRLFFGVPQKLIVHCRRYLLSATY
jgi:hypothetical protein